MDRFEWTQRLETRSIQLTSRRRQLRPSAPSFKTTSTQSTFNRRGSPPEASASGLSVGKEMKQLTALAIVIACQVFGNPTDQELLQLERITEHKEIFAEIESILLKAGFRKAKTNEVTNPTLHFDRFVEWAYFVQPIYEESKNELLIGYDKDGTMSMSGKESLSPMCDCPGDHLFPIKAEEMEEAIQRIWKLQKPANKAVDTTSANARLFHHEISKSTNSDAEAMTEAAVVSP